MRFIQFYLEGKGRRVGLVDGDTVFDLTEANAGWDRVYAIFREAHGAGETLSERAGDPAVRARCTTLAYDKLLSQRPGESLGWVLPPLDHPDPAHCTVAVTGLTHLGSTAQRDKMHERKDVPGADAVKDEAPKTDSQKMFEMGLVGGKPERGARGVQSELFCKGNGVVLRGHNDFLDIPAFTEDGGEEPEIVGCYVVDQDGAPCRLGFAIGNEWSDHAMEKVNYLWLGHSKMRTCSIGPELVTDQAFDDIKGRCRILRGAGMIYDSGELLTGESNMSHSLANLEDHCFKYPQFRVPGDVLVYYLGTSKFSFGSRGPLEDGDRIEVAFDGMGSPLTNYVRRIARDLRPVTVAVG